MKKLDWYIVKQFLSAFVFIVILLVAIIVVVDLTEKNGDFIKRHASTHAIIFEYVLNYAPYLASLMSPITVFIASVFVTAQLASRTEIIAMLSSGMSFKRFIRPYFIGACTIGVGIFYLVGWIIPNANKTRVEFERKYLKDSFSFTNRNVHIKVAQDVYAYLESYNNANDVGSRFTLERIEGTKLVSKLKSSQITWLADKKKWQLEASNIHTFNGQVEKISTLGRMDTTLNLIPKDFQSQYNEQQRYTLNELQSKIDELKVRGADDIPIYQIEFYQRFTAPFAVIILTCMGVILSARKSRGGVGLQIAFGFVLAFVYILFFMLSTGIAQKGGIPPIVAVWLPNIIFSGIAVLLYNTVPR